MANEFKNFIGMSLALGAWQFNAPTTTVFMSSKLVTAAVQALASSGGYPFIIETTASGYGVGSGTLQVGTSNSFLVTPSTPIYQCSNVKVKGHISQPSASPNGKFKPSDDIQDRIQPYLTTFLSSAFCATATIALSANPVSAVIGGGLAAVAGQSLGDIAAGLLKSPVNESGVPPAQSPTIQYEATLYYDLSPKSTFTFDVTTSESSTSQDGTQLISDPKDLSGRGYMDDLKGRAGAALDAIAEAFGYPPPSAGGGSGSPYPEGFLDDLWDKTGVNDGLDDVLSDAPKEKPDLGLDKYFIYEDKNLLQTLKEKALVANTYVDTGGGVDMLSHTNEFI